MKGAAVAGLPVNELERMLNDARKTLAAMRQGGGTSAGQEPAEQIEGIGEAAEGRIKVTAVTGGRITDVHIDPRAMRLGSEALGEQLAIAVNAALDDLRAKAAGAAADQVVDVTALSKRVEQLQNDSLRQMALLSQAITENLARINSGR